MNPAESTYVLELTSIRAIGTSGILLAHAAFWTGHYTDNWWGRLNGRFEIGVTIFFVLNALLLTGRWLDSLDDVLAKPPNSRKHFISCARRVLPTYWAVVTVAFLVHAADDPPSTDGGLQGWLRSISSTQTL